MDATALTLRTPVSGAGYPGAAIPGANTPAPQGVAAGTVTSSPSVPASGTLRSSGSEESSRINDPLATTAAQRPDSQRVARSAEGDGTVGYRGAGGEQAAKPDEQEQQVVRELARRDREVRAHEAAHAAAGGAITGAPTYSFARGPDGRLYATGGEVSVDTRPVSGDPEATIEKARTIIAAATAPTEPSAQDLRAAAQAQAMLVEAQAESARRESASSGENESQPGRESLTGQGAEGEPARTEDQAGQQNDPVQSAREAADRREEVNRELEKRLERAREAQKEFADQLEELNRRLAKIQQQLIETGAVPASQVIGSILDTSA